ncbi:MAG: C10 family peptidase [Bacteroidales bacterium]|nr:C10 family peptidase [Bacteroidales bacterium]
MKKVTLILTVLSIFFALNASAKLVGLKDAKQVGKNFYFERLTNNLHQVVSYNSLTIKDEFVEKDNNAPLYYVFNFTGKGFIIVSADDACYPVLGYSFETSFSQENLPENISGWLSNYKYEINSVREGNLQPNAAISTEWSKLLTTNPSVSDNITATTDVLPLVTNMWNQDFPYNAMCPKDAGSTGSYYGRVPVGCVATAMSQIMHYWRYPAQGQGSHCIYPVQAGYPQQCANFGTTTYDWNAMPNETSLESDALATLAWHCGISVDMEYHPSGSGSNLIRAASALKNYFKYASTTQQVNRYTDYNSWVNLLKGDIDVAKPIEYSGDNTGGGHAFVCDGYQQVGTDYMFHFNWGWGGADNGYYYINNLNPGGANFNNHQGAVVHISPDPALYPTYCTGTVNLLQDFGSVEDGSGPVADYQNNSNCSWLIAPDDSIDNITLKFTRFNTAVGDVVNVYDGADASAPLLGTFSGALTSMPSVISTGSKMFITFTSDGSTTAQGWMATYTTALNSFCASSTNLLEAWGNIQDGSGRFDYHNLSNCKWKIMPPGATKLVITVKDFNTEQDVDKLLIYDLGTSALLATLSGAYATPPAQIFSTTGSMMLIWQTNNSVRGTGWNLDYSVMVGTDEKTSLNNLSIYPNPANQEINVQYSMPEATRVTFSISDVTGKLLKTCSADAQSGQNIQRIDVSAFTPGIYLLQVGNEKSIQTRKLIIN